MPRTVSRAALMPDGTDRAFRQFVHRLLAFSARLEAVRDKFGAILGLSGIQYSALISIAHLSRDAAIGVKEVAEHLGLSGSFATLVIGQLTERFIRAMDEDVGALGVQKPDHEPRATQYVPQMLSMIGKLEQKGLAYKAPDGDVNYAVRKFQGYGKLSGKSLDDLRAGERVDVNTDRKSTRLNSSHT